MENKQFASAVHVVVSVAMSDSLLTSEGLAAGIKMHPVALRRVVSQLSASGILHTQRGKNGGIQLSKPCNQITLADIYRAVHCPQSVNCLDAEKKCKQSCGIQKKLAMISDKLESENLAYLSKISVRDFIKLA